MGQQIGERVIVNGKGEGTLEYYGRVRRSQTDHGKIMCGVSLDDRVGQCCYECIDQIRSVVQLLAACLPCFPERTRLAVSFLCHRCWSPFHHSISEHTV